MTTPRYRILARGHRSKPDIDIKTDAYDAQLYAHYPFVVVHLLRRVSVEAIQQQLVAKQDARR